MRDDASSVRPTRISRVLRLISLSKTGRQAKRYHRNPIKAGGKTQLNAGITEKYANAYDFKVVKK